MTEFSLFSTKYRNIPWLPFEALNMGPFCLFSKYKQKLPFCHTFWLLEKAKKEEFNCHQFFFTNKQYAKIKLMQNETNR